MFLEWVESTRLISKRFSNSFHSLLSMQFSFFFNKFSTTCSFQIPWPCDRFLRSDLFFCFFWSFFLLSVHLWWNHFVNYHIDRIARIYFVVEFCSIRWTKSWKMEQIEIEEFALKLNIQPEGNMDLISFFHRSTAGALFI